MAFAVDIVVSVLVSLVTRPKPEPELRGLVYSLTPKESLQDDSTDGGWYRRPTLLAGIALAMTIGLNLLFG